MSWTGLAHGASFCALLSVLVEKELLASVYPSIGQGGGPFRGGGLWPISMLN